MPTQRAREFFEFVTELDPSADVTSDLKPTLPIRPFKINVILGAIAAFGMLTLHPGSGQADGKFLDPREPGPYAVGTVRNVVKDSSRGFDDWGRKWSAYAPPDTATPYLALLAELEAVGEPATVITQIFYPTVPADGGRVESDDSVSRNGTACAANDADRPRLPDPAKSGRPLTNLDFWDGDTGLFTAFIEGNALGSDLATQVDENGDITQVLGDLPEDQQQDIVRRASTALGASERCAFVDAPIARDRFPLIVLSHGSGGFLWQWTTLAQHLTSHGYIVVNIQHISDSTQPLVFNDPNSAFVQFGGSDGGAATAEQIQAAYDALLPNRASPPGGPFFPILVGSVSATGFDPDNPLPQGDPLRAQLFGEFMGDLFQQRVNDAKSVIEEMKALNQSDDRCREILAKDNNLCGFFTGHIDVRRIGMGGFSLGSMTTQTALVQLEDVDTGFGFNNGLPSLWEASPGFPNPGGDPDNPTGVTKPVLLTAGTEDAFTNSIFYWTFKKLWESRGGDRTDMAPLPAERPDPTEENFEPMVRSAYLRASGPKMLLNLQDGKHGGFNDQFDWFFPLHRLGSDGDLGLVGFNPISSRFLPLNTCPVAMGDFGPGPDPACAADVPSQSFEILGWSSGDEPGEQVFDYHDIRNYYVVSWFGLFLKDINPYRDLLIDDPFDVKTRVLHEGIGEE